MMVEVGQRWDGPSGRRFLVVQIRTMDFGLNPMSMARIVFEDDFPGGEFGESDVSADHVSGTDNVRCDWILSDCKLGVREFQVWSRQGVEIEILCCYGNGDVVVRPSIGDPLEKMTMDEIRANYTLLHRHYLDQDGGGPLFPSVTDPFE